MADALQRTVAILVAFVLGAAGCLSLASAAVAGTPPGQVHAHGYDAAVYGEPSTYTAPDRGPPDTNYDYNTLTAVDRLPSRASARSDGAAIDTHHTYALSAEVAQGRAPTGTTTTPVELIDWALLSVQRWRVAAKSADEGVEGGLNLFKWKDPTSTRPSGWREGDYMLHIPWKGTPKATWAENSSRLRSAMRSRNPIYESYVDSKGNYLPTTGFLNAERNILINRGWTYNPGAGAWFAP